jgi:GT2 family glycosyltransferase
MRVAVVIVSYRSADDVLRCLGALGSTQYRDFEVVVCENGGEAAFEDLAARLPAALPGGQPVRAVLATSNLGFAGGVNLGVAESPAADAWWLLNPDTEPSPTALSRLVERLEAGHCEAVGGALCFPDGSVQSLGGHWRRWAARAVSIGRGPRSREGSVSASEVERWQNYLSGASMLASRRFWELAGPLREDYFLYCEEVEWCLRGQARGARLGYAPLAEVVHHQGTTTGASVDIRRQARMPVYLNERNRILLTRDRFPIWLPAAAVVAFLLIFLKFARRRAWAQLGYALEGWRAGLANERGRPAWVGA